MESESLVFTGLEIPRDYYIKKEVYDMYGKIIRTETDDIYDNGVENGQKELAINMYKNGMSAEMIAEKTRINLETIKQWLSGTVMPAR